MKKKLNLTKDNIKILICCHKLCELPPNPDEIFLPIQVGAAISNVDLGMQRDDMINSEVCDNISAKNKSFCELTALYWAWKNIKKLYPNLEYIGLNSYRRYFSFGKKNYFNDAIYLPEKDVLNYKLNKLKLENILEKNEVIIAKPRVYQYSLEVDYSVCHISEDLRTLKKIVHKKYPEYDCDIYNVITCGCRLSHYNMFIINWDDFASYCSWLFDILFEAEKEIDITKYNSVQGRIYGYMAERLSNVWIHHNLKKVKYLNIIKYSDETYESQKTRISKIKSFLRYCKRKFSATIFLAHKEKYSDENYKIINLLEDN